MIRIKYTSPKKKQEIVEAIMDVFNDVQKTLEDENQRNERNYGRYIAMMDLLQRVKIYEKEECKWMLVQTEL